MVEEKKLSPLVQLNNGISMPLLGLGVYNMFGNTAERAVRHALDIGYRLIDTAALYENEKEIGNAVRKSRINREEIFVTTKVANSSQGYQSTLAAFEKSLQKLNIDYIDLYLVHWPVKGKRKDTWLALEKLYAEKKVRAIGVANYLLPFLVELKSYASLVPAVNQVEFSPFLYLEGLLSYCLEAQIQLQAYSPLARGMKFSNGTIQQMAAKYNKSASQVMLRWIIQHGVSAIPKSADPKRLEENFDIFDFEISQEDMKLMDGLNENYRVVDNPMDML